MSDLPDVPMKEKKLKLGEAEAGAARPIIPVDDNDITVLVVDDNAFMRTSLREMLEGEGMVVAGEAADGNEAVRLYQELNPDVVVMDLVMPELDGMGAIRAIIEHDADARIVVCSGMGSNDSVSEAIAAGALDFLVKPFQVERVADTVRSVLSGVVPLQGGSAGFD
jgi:two-component system chemotaxis response regulator CheY